MSRSTPTSFPRFTLEARPEPSLLMGWVSPLLAAAATLFVGFALFSIMGRDPLQALYVFFVKPVDNLYGFGELLLKASPLMLCAIGLAAGYRANVWNIGAEGQLTLGALCGGGIALAFQSSGGAWVLPLMILAGALGGMAWAAIPAWLKTRFNASEILTSLMFVYVATLTLSLLVHGPWRDQGFNFPQSRVLPMPRCCPTCSRRRRSPFVFRRRSRVPGGVPPPDVLPFHAAVHSPPGSGCPGISATRTVWLGMLIGGATAGIAGVGEAAGPIGQLLPSMSPGYGFAAIIVAFVGRLHPLGVFLASLLMSLLYLGGESAQIGLSLPSAVTGLFQGTLLFFLLAADVFINFRLRVRRHPAGAAAGARPLTASETA
jgi:simple sugar transport system permease protein